MRSLRIEHFLHPDHVAFHCGNFRVGGTREIGRQRREARSRKTRHQEQTGFVRVEVAAFKKKSSNALHDDTVFILIVQVQAVPVLC